MTSFGEGSRSGFCERHYVVLAVAVLAVAAFNLTFRLGSEVVTEWDESLYAISAHEMVRSGNWIATTFLGQLDYYNTKPPLNVWLIALAFKALGTSLYSLRVPSVVSAWLTVAVLLLWSRRRFGAAVGLLAALVLSTTFGFLYVHSARNANTDALFTLLILLTVVTLSGAEDVPWRGAWLGPIVAAAFLLRGMAALMPLAIAAAVAVFAPRRQSRRLLPAVVGGLLFLAPVSAWAGARYGVDEWRFFRGLVGYDFVARSVSVLEGHPGGPLYYLHILVKHHYDWLLAGTVAAALFPLDWSRWREPLWPRGTHRRLGVLLLSWAGVTFLVPTLMLTKLPWYLNPFYPVFAVGTSWIVVRGLTQTAARARRVVLACVVVLVLGVAEAKLLSYSVHYRDVERSVQGLLLAEGHALAGQQVFSRHWDRAEMFVLEAVVRARRGLAADVDEVLRQSQIGDFLVASRDVRHAQLVVVRSVGHQQLYRRRE